MSTKFNTKKRSLRTEVKRAIKRYYRNLDGQNPIELYNLTLSQIEPPVVQFDLMLDCIIQLDSAHRDFDSIF